MGLQHASGFAERFDTRHRILATTASLAFGIGGLYTYITDPTTTALLVGLGGLIAAYYSYTGGELP